MSDLGVCDRTDCGRDALTVLVGEAGDLHLCAIHQPRSDFVDRPEEVIVEVFCVFGCDYVSAQHDAESAYRSMDAHYQETHTATLDRLVVRIDGET